MRPAMADEVVEIGWGPFTRALLTRPAEPLAGVILIPGSTGVLDIQPNGTVSNLARNLLVRTRADFAAHGVASLLIDRNVNIGSAVLYMSRIVRPVGLVGTSRGTLRAAGAIGAGVRVDSLVLASGFYLPGASSGFVQDIIGDPSRLPLRTLIVHNRNDACPVTKPAGVEQILSWARGKPRVAWFATTKGAGERCSAASPHGFAGADGEVVAVISRFVRGIK